MLLREDVVLFLDVDGTTSPLAARTYDSWGDQQAVPQSRFPSPVLTSPTLLRALGSLPVPIVWVTDWADPGPVLTPALFGRDEPFEHLTPTSERPWWKAPAVLRWLDAHRGVRHVIWCDDHLSRRDHPGVSRAATVRTELARRGITSMLLAPRAQSGLTPTHISQIRTYLDSTTAG